eukprot:g2835.t1
MSCVYCPDSKTCHDAHSPENKCPKSHEIKHSSNCPVHDDIPSQIRLAFAGQDENGNPNGMSISYSTLTAFPSSSYPTVQYGLKRDTLDEVVEGSSKFYGPKGSNWSYHHHVTLKNLKPNTRYFYKVSGTRKNMESQVYSFVTAHEDINKPVRIGVVGDFGLSALGHAEATRGRIERIKNDTDFFIHVGDIGYSDDAFLHTPTTFNYETVYDDWMNWMSNVTRSQPYMVAVGNHEASCHSPACMIHSDIRHALSNFTAYNSRFNMPSLESNGSLNMWYSFNYGPIHFIVINTETDFPNAPEEGRDEDFQKAGFFGEKRDTYLNWLENDLKMANGEEERKRRPWVVALGHRPIRTIVHPKTRVDAPGTNAKIGVDGSFDFYGPLLEKYQVDLFITGHRHSYSRFLPYRNSSYHVNHVINGGAGCDEMPLSSFLSKLKEIKSNNETETENIFEKFWNYFSKRSNRFSDEEEEEKFEMSRRLNLKEKEDLTGLYDVFSLGKIPSLYSMGVLSALNSTVLQWQALDSKTGTVIDEFHLRK